MCTPRRNFPSFISRPTTAVPVSKHRGVILLSEGGPLQLYVNKTGSSARTPSFECHKGGRFLLPYIDYANATLLFAVYFIICEEGLASR